MTRRATRIEVAGEGKVLMRVNPPPGVTTAEWAILVEHAIRDLYEQMTAEDEPEDAA